MKAIRFSNAITMLLFAALSTLTLLTLTGCQSLRSGTSIQNEAMQSLEPGMPYQEVVAELGPPLTFIDGERAIAYPWHTSRRFVTTYQPSFFELMPFWKSDDHYDIRVVESVDQVLCLRFDEQKRLKQWKYLETPTPEALQQEMKAWASGDLPITTAPMTTAQAQSR
jgi:hypothetical protein